MSTSDGGEQVSSGTEPSRLAAIGYRIWELVRGWFWQVVVVVAVIAFILGVVRPFREVADPTADDVAAAWNGSIARLGISPVFPPEEDIHVGDIWAVIAEAKNGELKPILGKAVRIGHLDLRAEIKSASKGRPSFAETKQPTKDLPFRTQDRKEVPQSADDGIIALSLAAFPGVTIRHSKRASGGLGSVFGGLGAGREDQQFEEIRIPAAETYGVMANEALNRFLEWCRVPKTAFFCSDAYVRRVISFAVTPGVLDVEEGEYNASLQLRLITRVFLTRELVQRRRNNVASGGAIQVSKDAASPIQGTPQAGGTDEKDAEGKLDAVSRSANTSAATRAPSGSVSTFHVDGTEVTIQEVFQRPVVFGYRAVTINLPNGNPACLSVKSASQTERRPINVTESKAAYLQNNTQVDLASEKIASLVDGKPDMTAPKQPEPAEFPGRADCPT